MAWLGVSDNDKTEQRVVLTEEQARRRRNRSIALALVLTALVVVMIAITIVKGPFSVIGTG